MIYFSQFYKRRSLFLEGIILLFLLSQLFLFPKEVYSEDLIKQTTHEPSPIFTNSGQVTFTIQTNQDFFQLGRDYSIYAEHYQGYAGCGIREEAQPINKRIWKITINILGCKAKLGEWKAQFYLGRGDQDRKPENMIVTDYKYFIEQEGGGFPQIIPYLSPLQIGTIPEVILKNGKKGNTYTFWWDGDKITAAYIYEIAGDDSYYQLKIPNGDFSQPVEKRLCMDIGNYFFITFLTCRFSTFFKFIQETPQATPTPFAVPTENVKCEGSPSVTPACVRPNCRGNCLECEWCQGKMFEITKLCENLQLDGDQLTKCTDCYDGTGDYAIDKGGPGPGIWSALGCLPNDPFRLINKTVLGTAGFGIAGGIAFLYFLYGAFQILTSMGNAEKISHGKEIMVSSISGLLLIIFSVLILQIVGVGILHIPGFS